MRLLLACAVALVAASSHSSGVPSAVLESHMAAPEIVIFHGGPLAKRVTIASWTENHYLLLTAEPHVPIPSGHRRGNTPRPVIELALFWGTQWRWYAASPERLATLTPAQATQYGQYYPAVPGARAMISVGSTNGPVSDSGLAVLRRHGLPTQVE